MDTSIIAYIVAIALLIVCSSFFSMSETAFTSASPVRLKTMAKDGNKKAERAVSILEDYDKFLTTILIGNNLVNICATTVSTLLFALLLGEATGSVASTVIMTILVLIFGEIMPKTIAKKRPEKVVLKIVTVVHALEVLFSPVSWVFRRLTNYISDKMGDEDAVAMTEDELEVMIDEIEEDGVIEEAEGDLIRSAIRFDDTTASEVYVPRMDVVALDAGCSVQEAGEVFSKTGFSRLPVYEGTIDNIVGIAYAKEFYSRILGDEEFELRNIIKPVRYVPETMSIADIFSDFQRTKIHMAVVLDSYGGTMGIITLEDVLEELVGEIWDESDEVQQDVVAQDDGTWLVKATANIYDVMDKLGEEFDPGEYDDYSVMGYVFYRLNRAPVRGDTVTVGNVDIIVRAVKKRMALECAFVKRPRPEGDSGSEGE